MALDPLELIIIGVVLVVFLMYGPKKIPELARALGVAKKEYIDATKDPGVQGQVSQPSGDVLIDTARKLGISTEGKTREQISEEIVKKAER